MKTFTFLSLVASACALLTPKGDDATFGFDTVKTPEKGQTIEAGSTYTITWETPEQYNGEKITINLYGGTSPSTLANPVEVASGLDNSDGSYDWAVKSSLGTDKFYGIRLISEKNNTLWQWSEQFHIKSSSSGGDSKSTGKDSGSATETKTSSKSTATATETSGDDNNNTSATQTSTPKTTETEASQTETSTGAVETTLTPTPSKSTEPSATGTESPSSASSAASQTNAAVAFGSSNMLALGGVAAALFAL